MEDFKEWADLAEEETAAEKKAATIGEDVALLGKKQSRKSNFGPWYIAPIVSRKRGGKLVGYGATCACHQNDDEIGVSSLQFGWTLRGVAQGGGAGAEMALKGKFGHCIATLGALGPFKALKMSL